MMDRNLPPVPLLTSENYFTWKIKITSVLTIKRLFSVISEPCPADSATKEKEEWILKNNDAVAYIILSLSDEQSLQFADETNAKNLWEKIRTTFTGKIEDRKIDASNELKNIEMFEFENVCNYIARARGISTKCASLGLEISERELVYYTVRGLKGKFMRIREILKTQREKQIEEVLEILREEEQNLTKQNNSTFKKEEAFHVKNNFKNTKFCFICKKTNHIAKNCYFRNKNNNNHRSFEEKRTSTQNKFKDKPKYNNANCAFEKGESNSKNFALTVNQENFDIPYENSVWILDSGCSSHMCNNLIYFDTLEFDHGYIQLAGKNSTLESNGFGTVKAKTEVNNSENILTIDNVIFAPNLRNNLISVSKLIDKGYKIQSNENNIVILSKNEDIVLKALNVNNRFEIIMKPYNKNSPDFLECNFTKNFDSYEIWHKRLCHLNSQYMLKMKDVINIDMKNIEIFDCESCDISKVNRKNHPKINYDQSSSILELIHADLTGPININSLAGSKYCLVLVDDFSGMYFSYFLKYKHEVADAFIKFKERYENLMNKRIKRLRTDNGLEFVCNKLDTFLEKSGIIHEKTIPYNPESNGKAERAIRVLVERARTLLFESELPTKFWAEAISCSTHVSNLTPRKNKQKTPIEIWSGKIPKLSYLKIFGCVAYYHVPKQFRNKFDVPAKRGIFVGYSRERIGYRLYDIDKNIVIEERSVKFNENIKGSKYLKNRTELSLWNIEYLTQFNDLEPDFESANPLHNSISNDELQTSTHSSQEHLQLENKQDTTNDTLKLRRSKRIRDKLNANIASSNSPLKINNFVPENYGQAISSDKCIEWKEAMEKELSSMNKLNVFELVKRPINTKIVKSKWIYSIKRIKDKEIYKARLVAAGYNQIKNEDFSESYSPVVNIDSFRLLIALAAKLNLSVKFFDIKTAYLYGDIEETVFMEIPPGYEKEFGKDEVCKLNRSIYGLPQSGRNWHIKLKSVLKKIGFHQLASDNCVFIKNTKTNFLAICVYVDDLAIFTNDSKLCDDTISKLRDSFEVNETTENSKFLGIEILQDSNGIRLSQTDYIESLINKYGMENSKKCNTPINKGEDRCFNPTDDLVNQTEYQEVIGELLYLANRTRPDLAFVSSYLSQFNKRPEKRHYILAKKVLKYLNGSKDKSLFYNRKFGLINCSADASWGNGEQGKSFSGCVVMLGESLISWKSRKQKCVGLSTCEAELFAIADTTRELSWIVNMLTELNCENFIERPIIIYTDSQAAIDWLNSSKSSTKTRHVNLKFHFVRDFIDNKTINTVYNNTNNMISDFLTKAVTLDKLNFSLEKLCLT